MGELTRDLGNFTNNFKPKINDIHQNSNSNYSYQNTNANHISSVNIEEMDFNSDDGNSIDNVRSLNENIGAVITNKAQSFFAGREEVIGSAMEWLTTNALPVLVKISEAANTVQKVTGATVGTVISSLVEGVGNLAGAILDTGITIVGAAVSLVTYVFIDAPLNLLYSIAYKKEWDSISGKIMAGTKAFVAKKHVSGWFDSFYENNSLGKWLKSNSLFFNNVREITNGVGYTAGIIGLTFLTAGIAGAVGVAGSSASAATTVTTVAGVAGFGKGTGDAWQKGASTVSGIISGALNGLWEGFQFFVGAKINGIDVFGKSASTVKTKLINSLVHVCLDGVDGGAETFAKTLIDSCYKDGYTDNEGNYINYTSSDSVLKRLQENFDDLGGFNSVLTGALSGMATSAISEVFDLGKYFKDIDDTKGAKKLLESLENNEITISEFNTKINKINASSLETIIKECDSTNILNEISNAANLKSLSKVYENLLEDSESLNKIIGSLESNNLNKIFNNFDEKLTEQIIDKTTLANLALIINKLDDNNTMKILNHEFKFSDINKSLIMNLDSAKLRSLFDNGLLNNTKEYLGKSLNGSNAPMIKVKTLLNIIDDEEMFKIFENADGRFSDASSSKLFLDASRKEYLLAFDELNNMINNNNYQRAFSDVELKRIKDLASIANDRWMFDNSIKAQTLLSSETILGNMQNVGKYKINTGDFLNWISEHGDDALNKNFQLFDDISNEEAISCLKDMYSKVMGYRNRGFSVYLPDEANIQKMIKSLDDGAFDIYRNLKNISDVNTTSLKDELLKSIEGLTNPTMIAKKLYNELNKRVNYSVKWMQVSENKNFIKEEIDIYNQDVSLDKIKTGDNIICKGWSQLYKEALVAAGFDESKIVIEGENYIGSHKWISVDLGDGNYILADATNAVGGATDLVRAKIGESELGFMLLNPKKILSDSNGSLSSLSKLPRDYFKKEELRPVYDNIIKTNVDNLDNELRKATGEIPINKIEEIAANFKKPGLVEKIFGEDLTEAVSSTLWNMELPENVNGIEAYSYLSKLINVLSNNNVEVKNNFGINVYVDYTGDSLNVIKMQSGSDQVYELFGKKIGKIVTASQSALEKYLYGYNKLI